MILGIDPGIGKRRCGFAMVSNGILFRHKTIDGNQAAAYACSLHLIYHFDRCVIERPRLGVIYARHLKKKNRVLSDAGRAKLAMNVGQNIYLADEIARELRGLDVQVKQVPPKNRKTKWRPDYWRAVFGWKGRLPSEHARDASIVALMHERAVR
jgi:hypothetical protein